MGVVLIGVQIMSVMFFKHAESADDCIQKSSLYINMAILIVIKSVSCLFTVCAYMLCVACVVCKYGVFRIIKYHSFFALDSRGRVEYFFFIVIRGYKY